MSTGILLFPLGFQELVVILVIVIVIFGASRIPELGKGVGEGIRNFKKGLKDSETEDVAAEPSADGATSETGKPAT